MIFFIVNHYEQKFSLKPLNSVKTEKEMYISDYTFELNPEEATLIEIIRKESATTTPYEFSMEIDRDFIVRQLTPAEVETFKALKTYQ